MSCNHPLKAWQIGYNPSGKPNYKITSYNVKYLVRGDNENYYPVFDPISSDFSKPRITEYKEIPCGHCIQCRLNYAKQWADRCMLELLYHDESCWITLTYNDEHLPPSQPIIDDDGVVSDSPLHPLSKRDFQLFIKRLRKAYPDKKIRYFGCGEYGSASNSFCPHMHIILFGIDFHEDRYVWKTKKMGEQFNVFYRSPTLERLWSDPSSGDSLGFSCINNVSYDTCSYTARYTSKKLNNKFKGIYDSLGIPPEFTLCSRRPGIGRLYYEDNKDKIYENQEIFLKDSKRGRKIRPPKYFDRLYEIDEPETYLNIKQDREDFALINKYLRGNLTSLNYIDMLYSDEQILEAKIKALKRKEL